MQITTKMTPTVIGAINGELLYQAGLPEASGRMDGVDHGVEGQLVTLAVYAQAAQEAWVTNSGDEEALHVLRKVAAIAIRALEQYGCPVRPPEV